MGFFDELGREVVSRMVNRTGEAKYLHCRRCAGFTRHISISHARFHSDLFRSKPERLFTWLTGKFNDLNPIANMFGRPYKCSKCGREILD